MIPIRPQLGAPGVRAASRVVPGRPELRACPLGWTLWSIARYLPPALVSRGTLQGVASRVADLPAALTNWIYFECHLNPRTSRVDLVLVVDDVGRAIIAGESSGVRFPDHVWNSPHWRRLRTFCREWGRDGSLLADAVHHIWLEFDLPPVTDDRVSGPPVPGLFISFGDSPREGFCANRWLSMARRALSQARGESLPCAWDRMLKRCFECLPASAYVPYVGMMLQRPEAGIRICLTGLSDEEIVYYATELGWPGSVQELGDLLSEVGAVRANVRAGAAMVHFEVRDQVEPAIGLEYGIDRKAQFGGRLREAPFLDHLVDRGLCSKTQREALGEWPGGMTMQMRHQLWRAVVLRRVNHIKLVHRPGQPLGVKAYLCAGFGAATSGGAPIFARRPSGQLRP